MKHVVWVTLICLSLLTLVLVPVSANMTGEGATYTAHPASEAVTHAAPAVRGVLQDWQPQPSLELVNQCGQTQVEFAPLRLMAQVGLTCSTSKGKCRLDAPRPIGESCCCPDGACGKVKR